MNDVSNDKIFDLVVPISEKDITILKRTLPYIRKNIQPGRIVIIANKKCKKEIMEISNVVYIDEDEVYCGMTFDSIKTIIGNIYHKATRRTGWYFQQFLKLAYSYISEHEYYMTWDSDTFPINAIDYFNEYGLPYMDYLPEEKDDFAYIDTIKNLWQNSDVRQVGRYSWVTEHMMFRKTYVIEMIESIVNNNNLRGKTFFEKILYSININYLNLSGFSEFETYAAFIRSKHMNNYVYRQWNNLRHGTAFFGDSPSEKQLKWASEIFDALSVEDFEKQYLVSKILCDTRNVNKCRFESVFFIIIPLVKIRFSIRMRLRSIIRK